MIVASARGGPHPLVKRLLLVIPASCFLFLLLVAARGAAATELSERCSDHEKDQC